MYEPNNYLIGYGYLDQKTKHLIQCDIPSNNVINSELELLYLLNTNKLSVDNDKKIKSHLLLLPHPSNAFLFGTWCGELIYNLEWMNNEEIKLKNFIIRENINSIQFKLQYLKNKKLFKQIIKEKCGIPIGIGHILYNKLYNKLQNDVMIRSSNDIYQFIIDCIIGIKYKKIVEIQLIFMKNVMDSTIFFNEYLKNNNFETDRKLAQFLKNILSLKSAQIQSLIPCFKSAFQITSNDNIPNNNKDQNILYNINRERTATIIKKKGGNKPITSFNIWLGRNVIYNKNDLIKQQNECKIFILHNDMGSQQLLRMGKKEFVRELNSKCSIPIGPLNLLYDNLPIDAESDYSSDEIVEFVSNYLYQLRSNNIERIRDRCIASNVNDEQFKKQILINKNNELTDFLFKLIKIKNIKKINELIPKIQQYAQNIYGDIDIIGLETNDNVENEDNKNDKNEDTATFGSWISELCFERNKLTKQQELIERYIKNTENNINNINDINDWDFRKLLINKFKISSIDTTVIMEKLFISHKTENKLDTKDKLIEIIKKILYDIRRDNMDLIILKCAHCGSMGIDDEYFLNDIVINDIKLEKFLIYNLCIDPQINSIPKLIENIRKYLKELKIINDGGIDDEKKENDEKKEENDLYRTQTVYGNKLGRWIGEIIHDRLLYLKYSAKIYDFIIINHWNSGILPHVGKKMFIDKIKKHIFDNNNNGNFKYDKLLNNIWNRLEHSYINNEDAFHASPQQIGLFIFEYIMEIRKSYIYQIGVECIKDTQCIDIQTFYTKIGSDKKILRKFIDKILRNTNQINLISNKLGKELIVEKIYYFLSQDVEDNNNLFENWLSNLIYDPVTLWLNLAEINNFLVKENINNSRTKSWGKNKFISFASSQCESLNNNQMNKLYDIAKTRSNMEDIYNSISEKLRHSNISRKDKYNKFIREKNMNKLSFLNVIAINMDKLIEFIDKDLAIKYNEERDFVNKIIEKIRLCLKIHTNLFDGRFDDDFKSGKMLFDQNKLKDDGIELKIDENEEKKVDDDDNEEYNKWVTPNMLNLTDFNKYQLSLAICYKLLENKQFEINMKKIYNNLIEMVRNKKKNDLNFKFDGNYLCNFILSAKQQIGVNKIAENEQIKKEKEKQILNPWKYKDNLNELKVNEITYLIEECLLNTNFIPYYKNKIDNISQKIIDQNMNGNIFVTNLNLDKNIFIHRMMECFGDKNIHKFVTKIYDDLTNDDILKNISPEMIADFDTLKLANYLKTYQIVKIQNMIIDLNIDGKEFCDYKRYEFAELVKKHSDLPIGVGTMLYKKIKTFKFIKPIKEEKEDNDNNDKNKDNIYILNELKNTPSIEFISLITKILKINDSETKICKKIWNELIEKQNLNKLEIMNENDTIRYIYGYQINSFYDEIILKIDDKQNVEIKSEIIKNSVIARFQYDDIKYSNLYNNFIKYIGNYFKSELLLIIIYRKKWDLLQNDGIKFLLTLDIYNITYNKLYNLKDKEIDTMIREQYKSKYNKNTTNNIIKEIKIFIEKQKKCEIKQIEKWTSDDIELYLFKQICNKIGLIRNNHNIDDDKNNKLCVLDILFCCKYLSIFIEEIVKNPANNMKELIIRKAKNQSIYIINNNQNDQIPQIVIDIFVNWIEKKVPNKTSKSNKNNQGAGFFSNILNAFQ